jgi:hypothetical protein
MKRIIIIAVIFFAALTFNAEAKKNFNGVGGYFYSQLAPYGTWIEVDYGVVVWRPTIIRTNWMPYQMGQWIWTYDGWYWNSYEPFGFITYHYGRWYFDDYYGWLWYPDYEWAPAWVEWRYNNNYIGWAPLHPYAAFSVSVGIYYTNVYYTPYYHWNYVTYVNFCDPYVYNYYVAPGVKHRVYGKTKTRHNFVYYNGRIQNRGVDVKYVSTRSGQKIKQRDLVRVSDSRELSRDSYKNRDEIRTLDLSRDKLTRNDLARMEIKRENRKTSVDIDKVKLGQRENVTTEKRKDVTRERKPDGLKTEQKRTDVKNVTKRVFDQNKNNTVKKSNDNRKQDVKKIRTNQDTGKRISKNENQVKQQQSSQMKESQNLNRNKKNRTDQVRKDDQKKKDQTKKNRVKQKENSDNIKISSTDSRKSNNRTKENDKVKERKRR